MNIEILEGEVWKEVVGYEGFYRVSNFGRILALPRIINRKSKKGNPRVCLYKQKLLKPGNDGHYMVVNLCNQGHKMHSIHRLVALHFIENPYNKPQVNHIDGNKLNCVFTNLEWVTVAENTLHAVNTGLIKCGYANKRSKPFAQYDLFGNFIKEWPSLQTVKKELGFNYSNIQACFANRAKTAYGFTWKRL